MGFVCATTKISFLLLHFISKKPNKHEAQTHLNNNIRIFNTFTCKDLSFFLAPPPLFSSNHQLYLPHQLLNATNEKLLKRILLNSHLLKYVLLTINQSHLWDLFDHLKPFYYLFFYQFDQLLYICTDFWFFNTSKHISNT